MSPQGLKKAIHALEKELDVVLFALDEGTGMPTPTPYAHELYEYAAVLNSNTRLLKESFQRIRENDEHTLRISCSLGVIGALGPEFLDGFKAMHPHFHVEYWETNDRLCEQGLHDGTCDVALSVAPYAKDCESVELYRCPVYFWVPANDPLARRTELHIEDLAEHDVALPGEGFKCYDALLDLARSHNVKLGKIFEMSEIFHLYEYAASGRGIGFTARHQVTMPLFARDSAVVALPFCDATWGFGIEHLSTHALDDAEQALWNYCLSYKPHIGNAAA